MLLSEPKNKLCHNDHDYNKDSFIKSKKIKMLYQFKCVENSLGVYIIIISSDGKYIYAGYGDCIIRKWNTITGEIEYIFKGHNNPVEALTLSHDNMWLYSGCTYEPIRRWNTTTGKLDSIFKADSDLGHSITLSHDGKWLYSGTNCTICKWSVVTNQLQHTFYFNEILIRSIELSYDDEWIFLSALNYNYIFKCNTNDWSLFFCFDDIGTLPKMIINNNWLCTSFLENDTICKLNISTGKCDQVFEDYSVNSIVISSDGEWLYSSSSDCTVSEWSILHNKTVRVFYFTELICDLILSKDDKWLYGKKNDSIVKIDLEYDKKVKDLVYKWLLYNDEDNMCDCSNMRDVICEYLGIDKKISKKRKHHF